MQTQFISLEVSLTNNPRQFALDIEVLLAKTGQPLRWAITAVNSDRTTATLEAVVTLDSPQ